MKTAAAAGAAAAVASAFPGVLEAGHPVLPSAPLKILILGGTAFLGPEIVESARNRRHTLTLFNRGKTNPGLFPDIEKLRGDRNGDLEALEGRSWDVVIDTSGYVPRQVAASASLLAPSVKRYVFISTVSVFAEGIKPHTAEDGPLATMPDEASEDVSKYYGALKALCEKAAESAMPARTWIVRPGLIVGPGDPTGRYTYWPVRLARGGDVLAPGDGTDPVQYIDVRDLAGWIVRGVEANLAGRYIAVGPAKKLPMKAFLEDVRKGAGGNPRFTWVPADFLDEQGVAPWSDMPVWVPSRRGEEGFAQLDCRKAIGAGLRFRPAPETARDTLAWSKTRPEDRRGKPAAGLTPEREAAVLEAWHAAERTGRDPKKAKG